MPNIFISIPIGGKKVTKWRTYTKDIINEDDLGMPENEEELEKDKVVLEG